MDHRRAVAGPDRHPHRGGRGPSRRLLWGRDQPLRTAPRQCTRRSNASVGSNRSGGWRRSPTRGLPEGPRPAPVEGSGTGRARVSALSPRPPRDVPTARDAQRAPAQPSCSAFSLHRPSSRGRRRASSSGEGTSRHPHGNRRLRKDPACAPDRRGAHGRLSRRRVARRARKVVRRPARPPGRGADARGPRAGGEAARRHAAGRPRRQAAARRSRQLRAPREGVRPARPHAPRWMPRIEDPRDQPSAPGRRR
jgi:hypothetical protein